MENQNRTGDQAGAAGQDDKKVVPLEALQAVREELQEEKARAKVMQQMLATYAANQTGGTQSRKEEDDPLSGMEEDDVLTVKDVRKIVSGLTETIKAQLRPVLQEVGEAKTASMYKDYSEVLEKYLPEVLKDNPALVQAIRASENPYATAYALAKLNPKYVAAQAGSGDGKKSDADKMLENLQKPGTSQQAGQSSGGLSKADHIAKMTDEEFEAHVQEVLRGK